MTREQGFTLVELLIVVFLISILAMLAVPVYKDYATRTKVAEGLSLASPIKSLINEYYILNGRLPLDAAELHLADPSQYSGTWTESIAVANVPSNATITITYSNAKLPRLEGNNTMTLVPQETGVGTLRWECTGGTVDEDLRPKQCRAP